MCLRGDCEKCRAQALAVSMAAEVDSLGYHTRYHTKKKPPKSFKLLKTEYAPATEMLANPDKYGGILAVLELLAKQTEVGG